ncbi:MAG: hypothetical protein GY829_13860 [Gammaproteobacteria bacterium]|nr:hypothetical protein [Gammaproteobacteria bacterium]
MKPLMYCGFVDDEGNAQYILAVSWSAHYYATLPELDGDESIIHNGAVHPASGGTGIPHLEETSFYTMYQK